MTAPQDRTAPDVDLAASRADEAAVAFTEDVRLLRDSLVESVVYALAELDCDTAAGDTYDPDHYREQATAATNAVLTHLAWSTAADPHAEVRHVRAQAWRTVDEAERIAAERDQLAGVVARVETLRIRPAWAHHVSGEWVDAAELRAALDGAE